MDLSEDIVGFRASGNFLTFFAKCAGKQPSGAKSGVIAKPKPKKRGEEHNKCLRR